MYLILLIAFFNSHSSTCYIFISHSYNCILDMIQCITYIPIQITYFWSQLHYLFHHNSQSQLHAITQVRKTTQWCFDTQQTLSTLGMLCHLVDMKLGPYWSLQVVRTRFALCDSVNIEKLGNHWSARLTLHDSVNNKFTLFNSASSIDTDVLG